MADNEESSEPSELVESLSALGGAVAGTAATFIAGPWVGSTSGVAVARVLRRVGAEIERWLLAPRQERRIAEAATAAFDEIEAQLDAGHEVRADFRNPGTPEEEGHAVELLEGVLRTAADEWEQRKVPYIGRIFAGLSFDASVTPAEGSYLIKVAERLTYQQVVLLAFWEAAQQSEGQYGLEVSAIATAQTEGGGRAAPALVAEMNDLGNAGLLGVSTDEGAVVPPSAIWAGTAGFRGIDLYRVRLTDMGRRLHRLMGLESIGDEDLESVLSALRGEST